MTRGRQLFVVFKVASTCNLDCSYCYVYHGPDRTVNAKPATVSATVAGHVRRFVDKALVDGLADKAQVVLHGGEPLMLKKDLFDQVCRALRAGRPAEGLDIGLQTNAVLVDPGWIDIFERHRLSIGVSIDGLPDQHDRVRLDKRGRGSFARTAAGLRLLQDAAGQRRIREVAALTVWTPGMQAGPYYRWMRDGLGLRSFDVMLPDTAADGATPGEAAELGLFLRELARLWMSEPDRSVVVRLVASAFALILGGHTLMSGFGEASSLAVTVDTDGEIRLDDALRSCGDGFTSLGLNVDRHDIHDVLRSEKYVAVTQATQRAPSACGDCAWGAGCRGGQLAHRFGHGHFDNPSLHCSSLKQLYGQITAELINFGLRPAQLA